MKRYVRIILPACLLGLLLLGCGTVGETVAETAAPPILQTEQPAADPMLERSLASEGNNRRAHKVLAKMASGESVTVGFIGGSITEGFNARNGENYAKLVTEYLDRTYSDGSGKVTCVNAGLAGTPSLLGLVRADRELLSACLDLIFIEFAVNDAQSFTDKQAYEALIRKCLQQENEPAVILLYSVTENGYSCQNDMALTAFSYDLPSVSVRDAIMPEITSGTMEWTDWSDDEVHPHREGHALYSRFITHLIDTLAAQETDEAYVIPEKGRFSSDWSGMTEYDSGNLAIDAWGSFEKSSAHANFRNSMSHRGGGEAKNEGLTFRVTGSALFLVYKATRLSTYGTAEVLVDGEVVSHLAACTADGWDHPVTQLIYSGKETETHEITIRMVSGDEEKYFDLLSVGVVQE